MQRFGFILIVGIASCGGPQAHEPASAPSAKPDAQTVHHLDDPDLNRPPTPKLLSIDWASVKLANDPDALALWQQIAPTGDDWQERLTEVPAEFTRPLARALLRAGNFACPAVPTTCGHEPVALQEPKPDATLADPCLRRALAMWSFDQLEPSDVPQLHDSLKVLAALAPPESELNAAVVRVMTALDPDFRVELIGVLKHAGQRELADAAIAGLDDKHLVAATQLHVDGALEGLSAAQQRGVFIKAIGDDALQPTTRIQAMSELIGDDDKLGADLTTALLAATKTASCKVAAAAAITLSRHGNHKFIPTRGTYPSTLRGLCVLAEYEQQMRGDESSPLPSYLPKHGLELVRVIYDPYSEDDADGDGDIHTSHTTQLIDRANASLPEVDILSKALATCTKSPCETPDHTVRLTLRGTELDRIEIIDRPPC